MRVAIVSAVYYPMTNGVAVFAHNLARGLVKNGHEVVVICPSFNGRKHVEKQDGVEVHYTNAIRIPVYPDQINKVPEKRHFFGRELPQIFYKKGIWVSPAPFSEVNKILKKFRPDVIHSQTCDPIGLSASFYAKEHNIALVTTGHNYPDQLTGQLKGIKPIKKLLDMALTAYLANYRSHSDYTTMPTELAIEDLMKNRRKKFEIPVEALSNGVDLTAFQPGKANLKIYNRYQLPTDQPIALYVGRVDPAKSIGRVVEAFAQVLEEVPQAKLVIVGDGTDLGHLRSLVKYYQIERSVQFLGKVMLPELAEVYKTGSLFVTASETETQGIVLIEAAATGLPIVAVDGGAVREICKDGENGVLCRAGGDIDGLAKGMIKILSNEEIQREYGKKSLELAKKHDLSHTVKRFEEIYFEAMERKAEED